MIFFKCKCCGKTLRAEPMSKAWFECMQGIKPRKNMDHTRGFRVVDSEGKAVWTNDIKSKNIHIKSASKITPLFH